ncbi:BamA/TamA family outer membrane protein [Aequorivita echinoideorum]|uniref:Phosphoesterase n=1 Tax=Aequorivita echinoideorum TaxID=1549647 RepID=A0ABS5S9S0_9FLAO|nr:phosphoesterase [Aequorivita echinoideorum]MBT0609164.1 phosphoesterase [Aequorivita echinoideorum]
MVKINIFITFVSALLLTSCATYKPQYATPQDKTFQTPNKEIDKTFFLMGNTGNDESKKSASLQALQKYVSENNTEDSYVLFLGNSFYPSGMIPKDEKLKAKAEIAMQKQVDALKDFKGKVVVVPGNLDWKSGVDGLELEEDFLKARYNDADILQPNNGCPMESIDINEDVQLIIVDTQWYLEDWDDYPKMNDKCDIKTRQKLFIEIENEIKKNAHRTIVFAMFHPLITNGQLGGQYPLIHKDVLSTLIKPIKTQGAISKQDRYNERYNEFMSRMEVLTKDLNRLIFVSGAEKSLQYIEKPRAKQIISGAANDTTAARLGQFGKFSYGGNGFARLDVNKDGSSNVTFLKAKNDGTSEVLYQAEIFPAEKEYDLSKVPNSFPATVRASVYEDSQVEKTGFFKTLWGEHYRKIYGTDVTAKVAVLDTLYGGLKVIRPGGGHQTRSLRLEDKDGKTYNMRALEKSAVQFLQTVIIKDKEIEADFVNTIPEELIQDFYTAAHPYGAFAIPKLADGAGVLHTNPKLFWVPKQKALGKYNENYGDELYMIVERPDKEFDGEIFGNADDVESTDDLLAKLREDEKYRLDEKAYVRARIFDMLIGDWDRHNDQWRFAQHKNDDGSSTFIPIPRDRDQVFSNFDGGLLDVARTLFNTSRQFQVYGEELKHTKWFNSAGIKLDNALINNVTREEWIAEAQAIQNGVTDQIIEEAFDDLPKEAQDESASELKQKLKGRRDNIVKITEEYYEYFSKLQVLTGTDKDDYLEVTRLPEGKTNIKIYRLKDGEKADLLVDRTFDAKETKEIWLYGLDDDDVFDVKGDGNKPIFLRIIGGQNNDTYKISNGRKVKVYDQKSKNNTIEEKGGASFRLTDNYDFNTYNYQKQIQSINLLAPSVGFNPDDGIQVGLTNTFTLNGFQRNPFTQQHRIGFGYYFATNSFDLDYEGQFANIFGSWNFLIGGYYKNANFAENFFGIGNETINPQYEFDFDRDYNRVRIGGYGANIGIVKDSPYGSFYQFKAIFEGIEVEGTDGRFITDLPVPPTELDETQFFATAEGTYGYESYDNKVNPTKGMRFDLSVGATQNIDDEDAIFGYVKPRIIFYNALSKNRKFVLRTDFRSQINIGNNYEFYQAAQLGGDNGLRGYRNERFTGRTSAVGSGDILYNFNRFRTALTPVQIAIFGGYDVGRVWVRNDTSDVWHSSFGGGLLVNAADVISGKFNLFTGGEGLRFTFGLAFSM